METLNVLANYLQTSGVFIFGAVSIALSLLALYVSLRSAHTDRINMNSWETYRAFNSPPVRLGRALALRIKHDTDMCGLPTYDDYRRYFGISTDAELPDDIVQQRRVERQHLHDLAAFFHQTGVLLAKGRLDREFTLLIIGPALEDRWPVLKPMAGYYEDVPYGGMYLLYGAYKRWQHSRGYKRLHMQFESAVTSQKK